MALSLVAVDRRAITNRAGGAAFRDARQALCCRPRYRHRRQAKALLDGTSAMFCPNADADGAARRRLSPACPHCGADIFPAPIRCDMLRFWNECLVGRNQRFPPRCIPLAGCRTGESMKSVRRELREGQSRSAGPAITHPAAVPSSLMLVLC